MTDHSEIAARWAEGLRGDWGILEQLTSPTMRVWHSHDDLWLDVEESSARMPPAEERQPPSFRDVRTHVTPTGFVVQAAIEGFAGAGGRTHIVQILTVQDGRIASCEEYIAPVTVPGA